MEEDQEETEDESEIQYEKREDPNHPYCTNQPIIKKGINEKI